MTGQYMRLRVAELADAADTTIEECADMLLRTLGADELELDGDEVDSTELNGLDDDELDRLEVVLREDQLDRLQWLAGEIFA